MDKENRKPVVEMSRSEKDTKLANAPTQRGRVIRTALRLPESPRKSRQKEVPRKKKVTHG